jgi:2-dehydropantoate 2-reductase
MLEQSMEEILAVGRACRVNLREDVVASSMALVDSLPPNSTTSMQRDIAEGRPSEIESWNGAVVRLGRENGVRACLNAFIYESLLPLELKARGKLSFAGDQVSLL